MDENVEASAPSYTEVQSTSPDLSGNMGQNKNPVDHQQSQADIASYKKEEMPPAYPGIAAGAVQHVASTADGQYPGQYPSTAGGFQTPNGQ